MEIYEARKGGKRTLGGVNGEDPDGKYGAYDLKPGSHKNIQ